MSKRKQLEDAIRKAQKEGDIATINKIKQAIYNAKIRAAEKEKEEEKKELPQYDFITSSKGMDSNLNVGKKINTDISRPNLFFDDGVGKNDQEKKLYVQPPIVRERSSFKMVDVKCDRCNKSISVHPSEYSQRKSMSDGQFVCDSCIGNRFRR